MAVAELIKTAETRTRVDEHKGCGRPRKRQQHRKGCLSHYRHAAWMLGADGRRIPIELDFSQAGRVSSLQHIVNVQSGFVDRDEWQYKLSELQAFGLPETSDLISTTKANPSTGTETLYVIPFDFDFKRACERYKKDGALLWPAMASVLQESVPEVLNRITWVVKSTSGTGLGVGLAISPIELGRESTAKIEALARALQERLIQIFNFHGMGADEGAKGLVRWMPNFRDKRRLIDINEWAISAAERRRDQVILELIRATDGHEAFAYQKKSSQPNLYLYPKSVIVERKLALLYLDLLENYFGDHIQTSCSDLIEKTSIAEKTVRKILANPPEWLAVKHLGGREGFLLSLKPVPSLTDRARELASEAEGSNGRNSLGRKMRKLLIHPSLVEDGDRYEWLGNVLWAVKLKGVTQSQALSIARLVSAMVPDYKESRALTSNLRASVKTFWTRRLLDEFGNPVIGSRPDLPLPLWLEEAFSSITSAENMPSENRGKLFHRKARKGLEKQGSDLPDFHSSASPGSAPAGVSESNGYGESVPLRAKSSNPQSGARPVGFGGGPGPRRGVLETRMQDVDPDVSKDRLEGEFSYGLMKSGLPGEVKIEILHGLGRVKDPDQRETIQRELLRGMADGMLEKLFYGSGGGDDHNRHGDHGRPAALGPTPAGSHRSHKIE